MYAREFFREMTSRRSRGERWLRRRREGLRWIAGALMIFALGFGYYAHIRGRFGRLKTELKSTSPTEAPALLIGGQEPVVLERAPLNDGSSPEFLSATFLPGRGMGLLQLTAMIPGRGVTSLLEGGTAEDLAHTPSDSGPSDAAPRSLQLPWAGAVAGELGANGQTVDAEWHGRALHLPATGLNGSTHISDGGLLWLEPGESVEHDVMPDGGSTGARFTARNFHGSWPSQTDIEVSALMSSRALDMRVTARNVGREPEPMGVGWIPAILLPSRARDAATLRIPSTEIEGMKDGRATGHVVDVTGTAMDYSGRGGKRLNQGPMDVTYTHLRAGFLDNGPVLELRDVEAGVGLRMTALSSQIRAVRVRTTGTPGVVSVGFQTNLDDPFSRALQTGAESGITVLQPGETIQYHVRFELLALTPQTATPL